MARFEDLKGKTIIEICGGINDEKIIFTTEDGLRAILYYEHD